MKVTRRFEFDAAHRLFGYDGPCVNIHGHHYVAEITVEGSGLDEMGMLIDFKKLEKVGDWINSHWDHALLLHPDDPVVIPTKIYNTVGGNPTAENMAMKLSRIVTIYLLKTGVKVSNIRLFETPDCWVDYTP